MLAAPTEDHGQAHAEPGAHGCIDTPGRRRKNVPSRSAAPADGMPGVRFRVAQNNAISGAIAKGMGGVVVQGSSPWMRAFGYDLVARHRFETASGNAASPVEEREVRTRPTRTVAKPGAPEDSQPSTSEDDEPRLPPGQPGYGGCLSHLVPNAILATTSRRISTHAPCVGCLCASCGCTVTPYWRDGWDAAVMLCNACGLRFQKFARRCVVCAYIPRKEDSLGATCVKCAAPWA